MNEIKVDEIRTDETKDKSRQKESQIKLVGELVERKERKKFRQLIIIPLARSKDNQSAETKRARTE